MWTPAEAGPERSSKRRAAAPHGTILPDLQFQPHGRGDVVRPSDAVGEVRVWNSNSADAILGYEARGYSWIHVTQTATFCFKPGASRVEAYPAAGVAASGVRDVYERSVLPLVLQAAGLQVVHASAVYDGQAVTAFAGVSRSGKSTIAAALAQHGFALWADDAVAFAPQGETVASIPLPFTPRLRASAAAQLAAPTRAGDGAGPAPLGAIVLLAHSPAEERLRVERVRGVAAFSAVLPHAYCFSLRDRAQNRKLAEDYLALAELVPVWRLRFRLGLDHLPGVVAALEALLLDNARNVGY
jgi:hypothetical protein